MVSTTAKLQGVCLVLFLLLLGALGDLYRLYGKLAVYAELERAHHDVTPERVTAKAECVLDQERVMEVLREAAAGSRDCVSTAMYDECVRWLQTCEAWQDFGNALDKLEEEDAP